MGVIGGRRGRLALSALGGWASLMGGRSKCRKTDERKERNGRMSRDKEDKERMANKNIIINIIYSSIMILYLLFV